MTEQILNEVLVVEDEPIVRIVAADALADAGIVAWEAGDADEALKTLEQHPHIRVLFTDINMPGPMNGLGLARQVSASNPEIALVITSGAVTLTDGELPDRGTFLPKPSPTQRLVSLTAEKLESTRK
jgi:CheY-like chemotaxis protein